VHRLPAAGGRCRPAPGYRTPGGEIGRLCVARVCCPRSALLGCRPRGGQGVVGVRDRAVTGHRGVGPFPPREREWGVAANARPSLTARTVATIRLALGRPAVASGDPGGENRLARSLRAPGPMIRKQPGQRGDGSGRPSHRSTSWRSSRASLSAGAERPWLTRAHGEAELERERDGHRNVMTEGVRWMLIDGVS
jgi:hypothetical protein